MNLLKQSSPGQQGGQGNMFAAGRLTPSPHYTAASTPGSPLTTRTPRSLLLQMGGENSAFKALVPNNLLRDGRRLSDYVTDSEEEINVNDESDVEETRRNKSRSSSPLVVDSPGKDTPTCQPLQLTMHDRD